MTNDNGLLAVKAFPDVSWFHVPLWSFLFYLRFTHCCWPTGG